ncbi:MAG: penicillin acylase family protein [Opitutaceae bacterium]
MSRGSRWFVWLLVGFVGLCALAGVAGWLLLHGSLAMLDGEAELAGLGAPVVVERDALGVPAIRGETRLDIARATGFVHAQDRFFQMDLRRRYAAGELAELFGRAAVQRDRETRLHRFRARAREAWSRLDNADRALMEAYAAGVNAGLEALDVRPFEYLTLRAEPRPWAPADCLLAAWSMFLDLQPSDGGSERVREAMRRAFSPELYSFFTDNGSAWQSRLDGTQGSIRPVPGAEHFAFLRAGGAANEAARAAISEDVSQAFVFAQNLRDRSDVAPGSNNWAVAGRLTTRGESAIVANDMHLSLRELPPVWYRARFVQMAPGAEPELDVTGITFAGAPMMVAGSNGHIAWGFTNANVDVADVVIVEPDPARAGRYLTPEGPREYEGHLEIIKVRGAEAQTLAMRETVWGPVLPESDRPDGSQLALAWIAHDVSLVNFHSLRLETATSAEEAMALRGDAWFPVQNLVVGDREGHIAWTLLGPIPKREGFDGSLPVSMADGTRRWAGVWREPPVIVDPESGRLWTANAPVVGGPAAEALGDGGFRADGRAFQIGQRLRERERFDERALFEIQKDNETFFLRRWRDLLLEVLHDDAIRGNLERTDLRLAIQSWDGVARPESKGHWPIRLFRSLVAERVYARLLAPVQSEFGHPVYFEFNYEEPLWLLVSQRDSWTARVEGGWTAELLEIVDEVLVELRAEAGGVQVQTWGEHNYIDMRHPLARFVPALRDWLGVDPTPMGGDSFAPNALHRGHGPSERFVVSPGREEEGIMHLPGGQSGHPLSAFFRAGHQTWIRREAAPFLPGESEHRLSLVSRASDRP